MSYDVYQTSDHPSTSSNGEKAERSNRRGQNLSLADRARGGHNSAKQQRRDRGGRFAGSTKKTQKPAAQEQAATSRERDREIAWR